MMAPGCILLFGTGSFAARIACDIAATASHPIRLVLAGRNAARLAWLVTACNARAATFGTAVRAEGMPVDIGSADAVRPAIARIGPTLVVQAASAQTASVIARSGDAWSRLVAQGGLSATAVFQALLSARVAQALKHVAPAVPLVNCCFPDVVNGMLAAMGLPVTCGVGNIGILSSAFAGALGPGAASRVKLLAHYQTIGAWRRPAAARAGLPTPRVWIDGVELDDVQHRFAEVVLTPEPAIEISGSASVPLLVAMATPGATAVAHAPGALGLPGGYPVAWRDGRLSLDLPPGLARDAAIAWNQEFEARNGLLVSPAGRVTYSGVLAERMRELCPALGDGFDMADLEMVHAQMVALRERLQSMEG